MFSTYFCAFWAALLWMCATILLIIHADALTFDIGLIANHLMSQYVPLLMGLLIVVDIALDTYVVGNKSGFFMKRSSFALGLVILTAIFTFFGAVISNFLGDLSTDLVKIIAGFTLFLLFLLRMLSYVKVVDGVVELPQTGAWSKRWRSWKG